MCLFLGLSWSPILLGFPLAEHVLAPALVPWPLTLSCLSATIFLLLKFTIPASVPWHMLFQPSGLSSSSALPD